MSSPSDGARPVAYAHAGFTSWASARASETVVKLTRNPQPEHGFTEALYTAADYDALRAEMEHLREVAAVRLRSQEAAVERCAAAIAKVEAGEARIAKALEIKDRQHWKFADEDPRDFGRVEGWNSALAEVRAALNEGDGE